ncbi:IS21 family transposase [Bacillus shivajii]|uniref:IS21 family transposase n=1 Tax=Bacillus shivajii TaxID=1983719 RepID=UPI001CFA0C9C|nr:IS21 family transposase [Bacillus shivajii]UCZ54862.1 IS21 family transposase [Bacillus shivajii]UCZ55078.1 IS21 family transposase [Bacillus shivajii]
MDKWEMYMEIQQLLKQGFSKVKVAQKLGVSRTTVYSYLKKSPSDMHEWMLQQKGRAKKLDPYKDVILSWLEKHRDMSASQVLDWLQEQHGVEDVAESTVRSYVRELRNEYNIPKESVPRTYEAIPDPPLGDQMQVDFGQTNQQSSNGNSVKLRFIAFVMSNSRYKYKEWLDRPFTTRDVIRAHENAFQYFEGITREIVYDQDALLVVSENGGDVILTKEFQAYKEERKLNMWVCRKADPESKGKIENVVGYIKSNFAKHRVFHGIDKWNEDGLAWLERTGNYKVHNTTKKRPIEVFLLEKQHLRPISSPINSFPIDNQCSSSISRKVRKDNTIYYQSNRYSVPLGTFEKNPTVTVSILENNQIVICDIATGEVLAKHPLSSEKGKLIQDRQHTRDRTKGIDSFIESIVEQFDDNELAFSFLQGVRTAYPRYIRDQLQIISKVLKKNDRKIVNCALMECVKQKLFCATDFSDMVQYLDRQRPLNITLPQQTNRIKPLYEESESLMSVKPATRDIKEYVSVLAGDDL